MRLTMERIISCLAFLVIATRPLDGQHFGPSDQPEAYFNGSSYMRLQTTMSLKRQTGFSFRTCMGGELISQQLNENVVEVSVNSEGIRFMGKTSTVQYEKLIPGDYLNNAWHVVNIMYRLGNLTMTVDNKIVVLLANASFRPELLNSPGLYNEGAVLIVGKHYNGCIMEGPSIPFNKTIVQPHNVLFTKCPIPYETCTVTLVDQMQQRSFDFCKTEPCMMHGACKNEENTYSCICSPRYTGKNCEFDTGNPCDRVPSICRNGTCIDDPSGYYRCNCFTGFTGKHCETEVKTHPLCAMNPCQNGGNCQVNVDQVECKCPAGFSGKYCENNVNECQPNPCKNNGLCKDGSNNYTCDCSRTGYTGLNCEDNINECDSKPCQNKGICYDTYGGYLCECIPGYDGDNCEVKMNECSSYPCLNQGQCEDKDGSFECHCKIGFGGQFCEYELRKGLCDTSHCSPYEDCKEVFGVPKCVCKPEYAAFPNCIPVPQHPCLSNPCLNSGKCSQWMGTYNCTCLLGFTGERCHINIDDCAKMPCQNGGTCIDNLNGFTCNCTDQWMGPTCERLYNACDLKPCHHNGTCLVSSNMHDYTCKCLNGYEGSKCEININDCLGVSCPAGKVCVDLVGTYECQCPPGYGGESCNLDIDPCLKNPCQNEGICALAKNGHNYTCQCPPNYKGFQCTVDVNECETSEAICNNGICVNTEGGFECYCKPGYSGERCDLDFDECLSQPCRNEAACVNKINNYECVCPHGYSGKDCDVNIDECESNPCEVGSTCIDGINEYSCICQPGMTGKQCKINIDDCMSTPCMNNAICIDGLNSYTCECNNTGYMGMHCEINIDDCIDNPCMNGATCEDGVKDYKCICGDGYAGKNCDVDINECESNPCQNDGTCLEKSNATLYALAKHDNTLPPIFRRDFDYSDAAGYYCICAFGMTGANCETNINECLSSPCVTGTCLDKIGYYVCECDEGYEGDQCQYEIDECEKFKPCVHGVCEDKKANYYCDCEPEYGGKNCSVELTGCINNPCENNGSCKPYLHNETVHRFNCTCPHGFHGHTCEKVTTMSLKGDSLIIVNTTRDEGHDIQFRFKTTLSDGFLALGKGSTYYILSLAKGRLNLHSSLLNKWDGVFVGSNLNDSNWQRVFVAINSSHLVLSANDEQTIYPINYNDNNGSSTSFPTTYIGGYPNNHRKLTHGQPFLVGCVEDVIVNGEWVLPETENSSWVSFQAVGVGCHREAQCEPNPCHSGGHCTDLWSNFSCACERPYLGYTCQYNYTAATFGYENITDSLVTVAVTDAARRAVRSIVDISMFIRTRQSLGQIFYMGSALASANLQNESYIAAQLEGGELLVRIQFNGTFEGYTVGGVKLNNGYNHLIEVIRNVTLVQVKLNGTEYFRKTISATGTLDAQVLFLGGQPQLRSVRQTSNELLNVAKAEVSAASGSDLPSKTPPLSLIHFKGIIQDVQISDGSKDMVVEFFPLKAEELSIPMSFGKVSFDNTTVLEGVLSDNSCKVNPCHRNGVCRITWNDYICDCPRGFKGKDCKDLEFCQLEKCPPGSICKNLEDRHQCMANVTFDGETSPLMYELTVPVNRKKAFIVETIELMYRTRSWGTALFAKHQSNYFTIFIYHDEVVVEWSINGFSESKRFRKEHFDGQWVTLLLKYKDSAMKGGFKELVIDDTPNFIVPDFDLVNFSKIFSEGSVYVAGSDNNTFDYWSVIKNGDYNGTTYLTLATDTTTVDPVIASSSVDFLDTAFPSYKVDLKKNSDLFKGCLSDIRIGKFLLPYFTMKELYSEKKPSVEEYFELLPSQKHVLGCKLCYEKDCYNGGVCSSPNSTYKCDCQNGFAADDCSIDINECEDNKCKNNATCLDQIGTYECECVSGYMGKYCDIDIDECESNPCHNGGTCSDRVGMFVCECPEKFVGKQCEALRLITCENQPCKNGSTCQNGKNDMTQNNFTCHCAEGMVGDLCDTPYCLVKGQGCENGFCNMSSKVPICQCQLGFDGKYCEINVDDCVTATGDSPCLNGGVCVDGVNEYKCNCTGIGYTGMLCETDIDECFENKEICGPIRNCTNTMGSYKCSCNNNMCGNFCNLVDLCSEKPCGNKGECEANCTEVSDYVCTCSEGWSGKNCTESLVRTAANEGGVNILYILVPIILLLVIALVLGLVVLINVTRSKRATRGTYSPSAQEFCNPRVELNHVLKPPPEERLI
ncbi:PREDICTED: protein crumbs isoform X2 [Nicrophorus vespilloides]|uniref:Protein crumbs isoform X2 n=1 Tax=Nicrophorus vespilloides TaxID=110193 RepID=A0ABM1M6I6_NICVS|nr:PREDICTED: protein crumbs isoform X2 [Nicrophorus vespilloides]